jgi:hypothetical protein
MGLQQRQYHCSYEKIHKRGNKRYLNSKRSNIKFYRLKIKIDCNTKNLTQQLNFIKLSGHNDKIIKTHSLPIAFDFLSYNLYTIYLTHSKYCQEKSNCNRFYQFTVKIKN